MLRCALGLTLSGGFVGATQAYDPDRCSPGGPPLDRSAGSDYGHRHAGPFAPTSARRRRVHRLQLRI